MNCQEVQSLVGPYLDSELESQVSLEIHEHLTRCSTCARCFATEARLNAQVNDFLRGGERSPALWESIEARVRGSAAHETTTAKSQVNKSAHNAEPWWRAWLWPSPRFYAGLAAVWALLLAVRWFDVDTATSVHRPALPPSPEAERILAEQRRELAEMLGFIGTASGTTGLKHKSVPPQGQWRRSGLTPDQATGVLAAPRAYRV